MDVVRNLINMRNVKSKALEILFPLAAGGLIGVLVVVENRLYLLLAGFMIALFFLSFRWPNFIFLAMIFFLPFTRLGVVVVKNFDIQPSQALTLTLVVTWIAKSVVTKKGRETLVTTPLDIPMLIFLLINVLSIYQSYHIPIDYAEFTTWGRNRPFYKSITQMVWMLVGISSYYVTVNMLRERKDIEKTIRVWIFSAGLVSAFAIYQFVGSYFHFPYAIESNILPARLPGHLTGFKHLMRGTSVSTEPTHFAVYLLSIVPLCFALVIYKKYLINQRWLKILFLLTGIGIIVTFSRTAILCIIGIVVSAWLLLKKRSISISKQGLLKPLILGIISIFLIFFLSNATLTLFSFPTLTQTFKSQFVTIFNPKNHSNLLRLASWGAALEMFFKHPFLGVGVGNYFMNYFYNVPEWSTRVNVPVWVKGAAMPQVVNNIFLETLCETGIFGLISFLSIFFFLLRGPLAIARRTEDTYWFALLYGAILSFVGVLIGFLQFSAFYFPFVWTLMGLLTAMEKVARHENRN